MQDRADELGQLWAWFAEHQFRGYSPLYERIAATVSTSREVLELLLEAPLDAHLPPVLFGCVHYRLLDGLDHPLADVYAGRSSADPGPLFCDVCRSQRDELLRLLEFRRVQTNDCGRGALLGPGMTWLAERVPGPLALVDVGASAGLNLIADRYRFDYGAHGATGPVDSPVRVDCEVAGGHPPIAPSLPAFAARAGLDRSPVDLVDPDDARWLLACVWPDTGRLERTAASIRLAQQSLPTVVAGDAVADLPGLLDGLDEGMTALVVNTWSYSYFGVEQRQDYVGVLAEASRRRRVAWLIGDDRSALDEVPVDTQSVNTGGQALAAVVFENGDPVKGRVLASVHQHGAWIDWSAGR